MTHVYFGYDCASPAPLLYYEVLGAYGQPSWAGRYLWEIPGTSSGLTKEEIAACHALGLAILYVDNGVRQGDLFGTYASGYAQGKAAGERAKSLGVPLGLAIVLDIEAGSSPSEEEMRGYLDGVHSTGYVGGFYLNVLEWSHVTPYLAARGATTSPCVVFSSEPEPNAWSNLRRTAWYDFSLTPIAQRAGDVGFHQYSINRLNGSVDLGVANDYGWSLLHHQPVTMVTIEHILRTTPRINGTHAINEKREPVVLQVGDVVHFEPDPSPGPYHAKITTPNWAHVLYRGGPAHGWCERAKIATN